MLTFPHLKTCAIAGLALAAGALTSADAGQRRFTHSYETTTSPQGSWEIENWVTYERSPLHDGDFDTWKFRHEIEYGVTSRFQVAVYVANWDFAPREGEDDADGEPHRSAKYESTGVELIYSLSNPNTDWIGSAVYLEANFGDRLAELEGKILLQKNFGPLAIVYNGVLEFEWEGAHLDSEEMKFEQTFGISYQVHPNFSVGGELVHEIAMPRFNRKNAERAELLMGPNVSFHVKNFFATASALWRTSDNAGSDDLVGRLIFGFEF
jgi:hypothetical protein